MRAPDWLADLVSTTRRRVRRMSVEDMGIWLDAAGSGMSKAFAEYVRDRDPAALAEFERGLAILVAMNQEVRDRQKV
ncbi:hypothetical protein ACFYP4_02540 [Streptomyces sp. NPDC005551]|uniref:hypothetical protein n=1 Tax=Streptomyces sp. NPDC005551 TaxID=3364725 RepID=UPI0036C85813